MQAIKTERLKSSISRDARGRITIDPRLADLEWERLTDPAHAQTPDVAPTAGADVNAPDYHAERARKERALARLAEIDLAEKEGGLVPADAVLQAWTDMLRSARDKLLAIPTMVKQARPHLELPDVAEIEKQIHHVLTDLATDGDQKNARWRKSA